jgi:hypothetical protein
MCKKVLITIRTNRSDWQRIVWRRCSWHHDMYVADKTTPWYYQRLQEPSPSLLHLELRLVQIRFISYQFSLLLFVACFTVVFAVGKDFQKINIIGTDRSWLTCEMRHCDINKVQDSQLLESHTRCVVCHSIALHTGMCAWACECMLHTCVTVNVTVSRLLLRV